MHEFLEHPLEVGVRICASAADLFDEGVNYGTAPAGVFAAYEHPVLVAELGGEWGQSLEVSIFLLQISFKSPFFTHGSTVTL